LAPVEGNSVIRVRCGQKNAYNAVAERGRACAWSRCFLVQALLMAW